MRDYWGQAGIETDESMEGGFLTIRPDFYVVRVSLLDMSNSAYATFLSVLREEGTLDLSRKSLRMEFACCNCALRVLRQAFQFNCILA